MLGQHLAKPTLRPVELVRTFGAMQAQEYAMAKWAIGLRTPGTTDEDIERLIASGKIIRSHPLRWTHHFVAAEDLRWILALAGKHMIARAQPRFKELGLDDKTFEKSQAVLARILAGGAHLTRDEIAAAWRKAGIDTTGQRGPHMLGRAELDGVICSGARRGKQITFALLEERIAKTKPIARDEALAELARRYFTTRGPATVQDFLWWSGLAAADARAAVAAAAMPTEEIDGKTYFHGDGWRARSARGTFLLPTYDEYTVAYRDRTAIGTPPAKPRNFGESTLLGPVIVIDGEVIGSWKRTIGKREVAIDLWPWRKLGAKQRREIEGAAERYAAFIGLRHLARFH